MFEFAKFPENVPDKPGYYYTYCRYPNRAENAHYYKAHLWNNNTKDWFWREPVVVLGFIPESRQDYYIPCVYWSAENKLKPFTS